MVEGSSSPRSCLPRADDVLSLYRNYQSDVLDTWGTKTDLSWHNLTMSPAKRSGIPSFLSCSCASSSA